jgi:hypothetical protein
MRNGSDALRPFSSVRSWRAAAVALGIVALTAASVAPVAAATPTITKSIDHHFVEMWHFDANPACGPYGVATTETLTGVLHTVIVDQGDSVHVAYGGTNTILVVPDDPALSPYERQSTNAGHVNVLKNGTVVTHESFHDFGAADWVPSDKIQMHFFTTFVFANGEVRVDRTVVRDGPPPGC